MNMILTDKHVALLRKEADRLADHADSVREAAEVTDDPEDWDAWKEADGIATGYAMALRLFRKSRSTPCRLYLSKRNGVRD